MIGEPIHDLATTQLLLDPQPVADLTLVLPIVFRRARHDGRRVYSVFACTEVVACRTVDGRADCSRKTQAANAAGRHAKTSPKLKNNSILIFDILIAHRLERSLSR